MKIKTSHWQINEVPTSMIAFVYTITNKLNGLVYIGKKNYYSTITKPPLKGLKRKRKVTKESNWKVYCSSSKVVQSDINSHGKDNFSFKIINSYDSKVKATYAEMELMVKCDVLRKDGFYNGHIGNFYKGKV